VGLILVLILVGLALFVFVSRARGFVVLVLVLVLVFDGLVVLVLVLVVVLVLVGLILVIHVGLGFCVGTAEGAVAAALEVLFDFGFELGEFEGLIDVGVCRVGRRGHLVEALADARQHHHAGVGE